MKKLQFVKVCQQGAVSAQHCIHAQRAACGTIAARSQMEDGPAVIVYKVL